MSTLGIHELGRPITPAVEGRLTRGIGAGQRLRDRLTASHSPNCS